MDTAANDRPDRWRPGVALLARIVFFVFLLTFISARSIVYLMLIGEFPNIFLNVNGTHVHHLNYGIFLLSLVGAFLLFRRPKRSGLLLAAAVYGAGMGLTYDEFGMWIHLKDDYWQRTSYDAIGVLAALFGLIAFAPSIRHFRRRHWILALLLAFMVGLFYFLLFRSAGV